MAGERGRPKLYLHPSPGVLWHDGRPLTAEDVAFTFRYMREHPYYWGGTRLVKEAEVLGSRRVRITLKRPSAPFLANTAATLPILPRHIWQGVKDPSRFRSVRAATGSGPYLLHRYSKEHGTYIFRANPSYYLGAPRVRELRFIPVGDPEIALLRGEVQIARVKPESREFLKEKGFKIIAGPHFSVVKLMMNHRRSPLDKRKFRHALAYAIDRKELVARALRGHGLPGEPGFLPPESPWYAPPVRTYPYAPERARGLLKELGLGAGAGGRVELELLTTRPFRRVAQLLKSQLLRVGISLTLTGLDGAALASRVLKWDFDLALMGHGGMGGDPEILNRMVLWKSAVSARFCSPALKSVLLRQVEEMDPRRRRELVLEAERLFAEELPSLALYYPTQYWAHDGSVPWFFTRGGIALGIPWPLNKLALLRRPAKG
ncbi:MAG: ABC transporter substrate-binding protein, partial [Nitrospinota bacterium]